MKPYLVWLLKTGISVVLDVQANTRANREWMMEIVTGSSSDHCLHYLKIARLKKCPASGSMQRLTITQYFI
jgi:hypothetical protein